MLTCFSVRRLLKTTKQRQLSTAQRAFLAAENSTARTAWKVFPNKVWVSPEEEELSFVKYAVDRLEREKKEENERHSTFFLDY
jgi:hypothetical protein